MATKTPNSGRESGQKDDTESSKNGSYLTQGTSTLVQELALAEGQIPSIERLLGYDPLKGYCAEGKNTKIVSPSLKLVVFEEKLPEAKDLELLKAKYRKKRAEVTKDLNDIPGGVDESDHAGCEAILETFKVRVEEFVRSGVLYSHTRNLTRPNSAKIIEKSLLKWLSKVIEVFDHITQRIADLVEEELEQSPSESSEEDSELSEDEELLSIAVAALEKSKEARRQKEAEKRLRNIANTTPVRQSTVVPMPTGQTLKETVQL